MTLPAEVRLHIARDVAASVALSTIARQFVAEGVPTARGGIWHAATVKAGAESVDLERELAGARQD